MTREQWLSDAVADLTSTLFATHGAMVPKKLRVSCGFPSKSALSAKQRRIGECWSDACSKDGHCEIFISPTLADPVRVLDVLVHELVHACVGIKCGHKGPFAKLARAVGLEGKLTATNAGADLSKRLNALADRIGPYPHAELSSMTNGRKKQGVRMVKLTCEQCGYVIRTTKTWLETGEPTCPCGCRFSV